MSDSVKPIYLLADSQLLFWKQHGSVFLESVRSEIVKENPKAAYIGASNDDQPEFYQIFEAGMEGLGIRDCRMIRASFPDDDAAFLEEADLILLAGGDVETGWNAFQQNGFGEAVVRRYYEGALLIGVSAGAVQLGWAAAARNGDDSSGALLETFKLVPYIVGVHEEKTEWQELNKLVVEMKGAIRGLGIPSGAGAIYRPGRSIEPLRHLLSEYLLSGNSITRNLLVPVSDVLESTEVN
jgi:cyanophycinase